VKNESLLRNYVRALLGESTAGEKSAPLAALVADETDRGSLQRTAAYIYELGGDGSTIVPRGYVEVSLVDPEVHGRCNGAAAVTGSWAKNKGDGRMVYGIASALSPSGALIPDRILVSPSARSGWSKQLASQPSKPLDDSKHKACGPDGLDSHTEDPSDDCRVHGDRTAPYLDRSYENPARGAWLAALAAMQEEHGAHEAAGRVTPMGVKRATMKLAAAAWRSAWA
jgi:hypothetical protein